MKTWVLGLILFLSGAVSAAEFEGRVTYSDSGALIVEGKAAEKMYADLDGRAIKMNLEANVIAWRKRGKNFNCFLRNDTHEVQCFISVRDPLSGEIY